MPVSSRQHLGRLHHVTFLGDHGRSVGVGHGPHDGDPVVGLVVEDAVGRRVADVLPRPHALGPVRRRRRSGRPRRTSAARPAPTGRSSRSARRAVPGRVRPRADRPTGRRRSAPPPTWTKTRSRSAAPPIATHCTDISHPMVRPPSRHHAFSGPCTLNGTAPAATASRKRCTHGSPGGSVGEPRAGDDRVRRARRAGRARPRLADGGTNTSDRPAHRRGQRGRGERRVAARRDRERRSVGLPRPTVPGRRPRRSPGAAGS